MGWLFALFICRLTELLVVLPHFRGDATMRFTRGASVIISGSFLPIFRGIPIIQDLEPLNFGRGPSGSSLLVSSLLVSSLLVITAGVITTGVISTGVIVSALCRSNCSWRSCGLRSSTTLEPLVKFGRGSSEFKLFLALV